MLQGIVATHMSETVARGFDDPALRRDIRQRFGRRSYGKLIELVEAHDVDGAEQHWRSHMEAASTYVLQADLKNERVVDLFS